MSEGPVFFSNALEPALAAESAGQAIKAQGDCGNGDSRAEVKMTAQVRPPGKVDGHRHPVSGRSLAFLAAKDALALLGLWAIYTLVRNLSGNDLTAAIAHSNGILQLQNALGMPSEAVLQTGLLGHPQVVRAANIYYMVAHFPVTLMFLVWVWLRHRAHFPIVRNTLILVTATGLALHLVFPLAPPRMLPGFVDTGVVFGQSPYFSEGIARTANQLAAMPSLHVAWALLVALSVVAVAKHPARHLAFIHPAITTFVVVLTANHYWTDVIVAVVLVLLAWVVLWRREQELVARAIAKERRLSAPRLFVPLDYSQNRNHQLVDASGRPRP